MFIVLEPQQAAWTLSVLGLNTASGKHDRSGSERNPGSSGSAAEGKWGAASGRGEAPGRAPGWTRAGSWPPDDGLEQRLCLQGVLRQIPVVGSVLNWFSPVQASQKGRTFNLTAGRPTFLPLSRILMFDQVSRDEEPCLRPRLHTRRWARTWEEARFVCRGLSPSSPVPAAGAAEAGARAPADSPSWGPSPRSGPFRPVLIFFAALISVLPPSRAAFARGKWKAVVCSHFSSNSEYSQLLGFGGEDTELQAPRPLLCQWSRLSKPGPFPRKWRLHGCRAAGQQGTIWLSTHQASAFSQEASASCC